MFQFREVTIKEISFSEFKENLKGAKKLDEIDAVNFIKNNQYRIKNIFLKTTTDSWNKNVFIEEIFINYKCLNSLYPVRQNTLIFQLRPKWYNKVRSPEFIYEVRNTSSDIYNITYNNHGILKYVSGYGNINNVSIIEAPNWVEPRFHMRCEIKLKFFKDWKAFDFEQIISLPNNKIYGIHKTNYFFELPLRDTIPSLNFFRDIESAKLSGNFRRFYSRYQTDSYKANIKKGMLYLSCSFYYTQGDNTRYDYIHINVNLADFHEKLDYELEK